MIKQQTRFFLLFTALLLSFIQGIGQDVPLPYNNGIKVNYVRMWDAQAPEKDPVLLIGRPLADVKQSTQYLDGLGRPLQTVVKEGTLQANGSKADLVIPVVYDAFGREAYKYLPFAANSTGGNSSVNDGNFKLNPFAQQQHFYSDAHSSSPVKGQGETFYYGKTDYEASPLNRVMESFAAGNNWAGTAAQSAEADRRAVKTRYLFNTALDGVRLWQVNDAPDDWGSYATPGTYPANELYKTVTVDEHNKQVIEFTDKEGQVILKKVQLTASNDDGTGQGHTGWLCTYYIYDDFNRLRAVIQPELVKQLATYNSWNVLLFTGVLLNEQCFRYEYDGRNRMIRKKVPGAGEVRMIYDVRDRLVYTQDVTLRARNQWHTTLYDELNRPVLTGLVSYTGSFATLASLVTTQTAVARPPGVPLTTDLVMDGMHIGRIAALHSISLEEDFETVDGSIFEAAIVTDNGFGRSPLLNNAPISRNPLPTLSAIDVLTNTFYDDYTWRSEFNNPLTANRDASYDTYLLAASGGFPYAETPAASAQLTGLVTGTRTRVLGTADQYLFSVHFYDDKGRVIQTQSTNITKGTDMATMQYSWSGHPLLTIQKQEHSGTPSSHTLTLTKLTYDDLWRVSKLEKKVGSSAVNSGSLPADWIVIAENEYDALGQLKTKKVGRKKDEGVYTSDPLETVQYEYNIRGWLLGANRSYAKDLNEDHYFGFDLGYDKADNKIIGHQTYTTPQFNGNIAGTVWKSKGDGEKRKYDFSYDAVNRLTGADFNQYTNTAFNKTAGIDFTVSDLSYDANGNIKRMKQMGLLGMSSGVLDNLYYTYKENGLSNKLLAVSESAIIGTTDHKSGDFTDKNTTQDDYDYDVNGNLLYDKNKDIASIAYNHLNLPSLITITGKGTIAYTYDAAGNKLKKVVTDNTPSTPKTTSTLYLGGSVYENNALQFMGMEEGRIRLTPAIGNATARLDYDYFLKDHLGNIRAVLTDEQQTAHYLATMETGNRAVENQLFDNIDAYAVNKSVVPGGYPTDNTTSPNDYVSRLNGINNQVGPSIVLKVMAGDELDLGVKYFYRLQAGSTTQWNADMQYWNVIDALTRLVQGASGISKALNPTDDYYGWVNLFGPAVVGFTNNQSAIPSGKPKASLNWLFVNEQFKGDGTTQSGSLNVNSPDELLTLAHNITIQKNGYLYIYISNETANWPVFFDNLSVQHRAGPLREETHFYPFGLTMQGISSKALGSLENRRKFNDGTELENKEFLDGSGLEWYATDFRSYDPQIGRFHQMDPLAEATYDWSPYVYCYNNPVLMNDPLGLLGDTVPHMEPVIVTPGNNLPSIRPDNVPRNEPDVAGASPLPSTPSLYPIPGGESPGAGNPGNPGKVIPFDNPAPNPGPNPWVMIGTRATLLLAGLLYSNPVGQGSDKVPYSGHGNNKDNSNPHIVYRFTYTPPDAGTPVLKYGISDGLRNGTNRPDKQKAALKLKYGPSVKMTVLAGTPDRTSALAIEAMLVGKHLQTWGEMPLEQRRPIP